MGLCVCALVLAFLLVCVRGRRDAISWVVSSKARSTSVVSKSEARVTSRMLTREDESVGGSIAIQHVPLSDPYILVGCPREQNTVMAHLFRGGIKRIYRISKFLQTERAQHRMRHPWIARAEEVFTVGSKQLHRTENVSVSKVTLCRREEIVSS